MTIGQIGEGYADFLEKCPTNVILHLKVSFFPFDGHTPGTNKKQIYASDYTKLAALIKDRDNIEKLNICVFPSISFVLLHSTLTYVCHYSQLTSLWTSKNFLAAFLQAWNCLMRIFIAMHQQFPTRNNWWTFCRITSRSQSAVFLELLARLTILPKEIRI